jgi:tripartite-type tricarboxylate transporter receptor subunit TctC
MRTLKLIAAAFLLAAVAAAAAAEQTNFPARPVKLVVPFAAGGPTDVVARILGDLLSARWGGQSVVIENRPGAGTIVATAAVAKSPPDGYTLLVATNSLLINPALGQKLPYDTQREFAAVSMVATSRSRSLPTNRFPPTPFQSSSSSRSKAASRSTSPRPGRVGSAISPAKCSSSAPAS